MKTPLSPASVKNFTPVRGAAAALPKPNMSTSKDALMSSDLELQTGIGEWKPVHVELVPTGLRMTSIQDGKPNVAMVYFRPETRITIPMRNLKREAQFKGCAFQVETQTDIKAFMAPSLAEKNAWARRLNLVLGDLRAKGGYEGGPADENDVEDAVSAPTTPVGCVSVDRQQRAQQKAGAQMLAMSLQPKKTMGRTEATMAMGMGMVASLDRSEEIGSLQREIGEREQQLQEKEKELKDALQQLHREQQYREQITQGVEKWRQDMTRQKDQKIQDTRERLDQEVKRAAVLEEENSRVKGALEDANEKIATLEERVRELESELLDRKTLKQEIADLRIRLEKEVQFVQVLEHDTRQMAEELMVLHRQHEELKVKHDHDTNSYRHQCEELQIQLQAKEEENLALKEEVGQLRSENKRLQEQQGRMHREFFFSLALSIKLSLAQQGIYSNADLNQLYEQVLSEPFANWTKSIESKLISSQMTVTEPAAAAVEEPQTPLGPPQRRAQPQRSAKKKTGFFW